MKRHSLTARLMLTAALGAIPILILAGILLLSLFTRGIEARFDAYLIAYQQALIGGAEAVSGGSGGAESPGALRLAVEPADARFTLPFSGWYWQISRDDRVLLQSASAGPLQANAIVGFAIAGAGDRTTALAGDAIGPGGVALRAVSRPIRLAGGDDPVLFTVAGPRAEIDAEIRAYGTQVTLILAALGLAFLAATALQVRFGLAPLNRMLVAVAAIRAGKAQRLGDAEPDGTLWPTEVAPMVSELDALIEHNAMLIERARHQAGNLAHALKNPLSALSHELRELPGESGTLAREQVALIGAQVDRALARIRIAGPAESGASLVPLRPIVEDLAFSLHLLHRERSIAIEVEIDPALNFLGDRQDLTEMLGNLMDNACKWASTRIRVEARRSGQSLDVAIDDDGPGIPPDRRLAALARGQRLDQSKPGTGLGLDIVREIAELYRGALTLDQAPLGGLRATLRLPGG